MAVWCARPLQCLRCVYFARWDSRGRLVPPHSSYQIQLGGATIRKLSSTATKPCGRDDSSPSLLSHGQNGSWRWMCYHDWESVDRCAARIDLASSSRAGTAFYQVLPTRENQQPRPISCNPNSSSLSRARQTPISSSASIVLAAFISQAACRRLVAISPHRLDVNLGSFRNCSSVVRWLNNIDLCEVTDASESRSSPSSFFVPFCLEQGEASAVPSGPPSTLWRMAARR